MASGKVLPTSLESALGSKEWYLCRCGSKLGGASKLQHKSLTIDPGAPVSGTLYCTYIFPIAVAPLWSSTPRTVVGWLPHGWGNSLVRARSDWGYNDGVHHHRRLATHRRRGEALQRHPVAGMDAAAAGTGAGGGGTGRRRGGAGAALASGGGGSSEHTDVSNRGQPDAHLQSPAAPQQCVQWSMHREAATARTASAARTRSGQARPHSGGSGWGGGCKRRRQPRAARSAVARLAGQPPAVA